ncbi:hypothetical protein [Streptomyces sp. CBMA29]|uniref:hypothetical protein n=1 Tax=Streptomyces sp. CBMA29 TaxID=1896314 RepID=UPI001661C9C5|nr:hypothetical protein [Streptomyces sp. CBMA29]MBD0736151.1 hypothetical protein [Streptomyces sp. CBMA29]
MAGTWLDLMDRLAALGEVAAAPLDPGTRRLSLLRVARDCEAAASAARVLAETEAADAAAGVSGRE